MGDCNTFMLLSFYFSLLVPSAKKNQYIAVHVFFFSFSLFPLHLDHSNFLSFFFMLFHSPSSLVDFVSLFVVSRGLFILPLTK